MKKFVILFTMLLIPLSVFSQNSKKLYPFSVKVKGKGNPIILISGQTSGDIWQQSTDALQNKYECHILTLAGFANQKPINLNKGFIPFIKEEIIHYIQNELSAKPIVIGHSLGGFLTLSIASSTSELLSQIIIVDSYAFAPVVFNPDATKDNIRSQAEQMRHAIRTMPDSLFIKQENTKLKTMITDEEHIELATRWLIDSDRETLSLSTFEMMTTDLRDQIEHIKIPILVLGSWYGLKDYGITKDFVHSAYKKQFSNAINCKIEIAETAKHFIMWDEPRWFYEKVESFISADE